MGNLTDASRLDSPFFSLGTIRPPETDFAEDFESQLTFEKIS
jgi:hypothetical protein